jgi:hypothetical protein
MSDIIWALVRSLGLIGNIGAAIISGRQAGGIVVANEVQLVYM